MLNKLLLAVDDSKYSELAAGVAIDLALRYNASLDVISVVPLPMPGGSVGEVNEIKTEGERRLGKALESVRRKAEERGQPVKTELLYGHVAENIIKYATNSKADLIVMGYKGSSAVKDFLLGSVSTRVLHHAPGSVLLVRD
ncbi:MAG: universal stress protein [Syntrophomonadaceae bacterium]|nr:universal stress protein [Syntrophomonadaceae bacterium]